MAHIEFGIMDQIPLPGQRYDDYTPEKYHCISVLDEVLDPVLSTLESLPCFWHTLDCPAHGLAYCGVTLIPPDALLQMAAVTDGVPALSPLTDLLRQAASEGKFVIHFGL